MGCTALKIMANSGQLINLACERNMARIFRIFSDYDVPAEIRTSISETLIVIAKNIGLRKIFLGSEIRK